MNEKKYLIDDEPSSAKDIIKKATEYDANFSSNPIKQTSVAAGILRDYGISVEPIKNK